MTESMAEKLERENENMKYELKSFLMHFTLLSVRSDAYQISQTIS